MSATVTFLQWAVLHFKKFNCSSFSTNRHAFQIRENPLQRSTKNTWPRKQKSSTYFNFSVWEHIGRIHLFYVKLLNFSIYFFFSRFRSSLFGEKDATNVKNGITFSDCLWHRSCIPLAVRFQSFIYLFSNFLQVFKHQKVKKKAKPNSKKKKRKPKGIGKGALRSTVPSVRFSKRFFGNDASAHQRKEGRINTS